MFDKEVTSFFHFSIERSCLRQKEHLELGFPERSVPAAGSEVESGVCLLNSGLCINLQASVSHQQETIMMSEHLNTVKCLLLLSQGLGA